MGSEIPSREFDTRQAVLLGAEIYDAVRLIEAGLAGIQRIDGVNDFYHAPILLLSTGFERLLKTILLLKWKEGCGDVGPERPDIPIDRSGHSIRVLLGSVIARCYKAQNPPLAPALADDQTFLESDATLGVLVDILTSFGSGGRYFYLDVARGKNREGSSPQDRWQKLELDLLVANGMTLKQLRMRSSQSLYGEVNSVLLPTIERFARALARLFTMGPLGESGRMYSGVVGIFLNLRNDELGTRQYRW